MPALQNPEFAVQVTRAGPTVAASEVVESVRQKFELAHCVRLPQFLEPGLIRLLSDRIPQAEFYFRRHGRIGTEACMTNNNVVGLLHFLVNHPRLFRLVETVAGCAPIGCFAGRVYRMSPGSAHYDSWHSDAGEGRLIGLSVNLSSDPYLGGVFQLRDRQSQALLCEMPNVHLGDAILFRISRSLEHRVTAVEGSVPKTAFAGWFQSQPDYRVILLRSSPFGSRVAQS